MKKKKEEQIKKTTMDTGLWVFFSEEEEPISYEEAVININSEKWKEVMDSELNVLKESMHDPKT